MAVVKKISELTPKGANLANNDLLIVGVSNGTDYDLKSVTGAELLSTAVAQTITNGVTTTAPSQDAVYDALQNKVDKVTGSRLITSAEGTILSNTSGTNTGDETSTTIKTKLGITTLSGSNTGDQTLQQVTNLGSDTSSAITSTGALYRGTLSNATVQSATLIGGKYTSIDADGKVQINTSGTATGVVKTTNLVNTVTLEFPNKSAGSYTIATSDDFIKPNYSINTQIITSSATVTPTFLNDIVTITAQATALTLANPTGTPIANTPLFIRIKDNGTARAITFDTQYRSIGVTLPTTTVANKTMYLGMIYNSTDTKWDILGYNIEV